MKLKSIAALCAAAVLLAFLAYRVARESDKHSTAPADIGAKVLPDLAINRVAKITITSGTGTVVLAKSKDKWVVASRFNYPANFDKVADTVRELSELKIGQRVNVAGDQISTLNLLRPEAGSTNAQPNSGSLVELRDEQNGFLASLLIGKGFTRRNGGGQADAGIFFGGYADGRYVQTFDGKIYLVAKNLERLTESANTWLADDFVSAPAADLKEINVSGPGREEIKLARKKDGGDFALTGLSAGEQVESSKINQVAGALHRLGFDEVADPALPVKTTGLDNPVIFEAISTNGVKYTVKIGNTISTDSFDRYCSISADAAEKAPETAPADAQKTPAVSPAETAANINSRFGNWVYVIRSYRAEPMLTKRSDLIKKPEPPKAAETNVPPGDAG